jgi:hypothetical protein
MIPSPASYLYYGSSGLGIRLYAPLPVVLWTFFPSRFVGPSVPRVRFGGFLYARYNRLYLAMLLTASVKLITTLHVEEITNCTYIKHFRELCIILYFILLIEPFLVEI